MHVFDCGRKPEKPEETSEQTTKPHYCCRWCMSGNIHINAKTQCFPVQYYEHHNANVGFHSCHNCHTRLLPFNARPMLMNFAHFGCFKWWTGISMASVTGLLCNLICIKVQYIVKTYTFLSSSALDFQPCATAALLWMP